MMGGGFFATGVEVVRACARANLQISRIAKIKTTRLRGSKIINKIVEICILRFLIFGSVSVFGFSGSGAAATPVAVLAPGHTAASLVLPFRPSSIKNRFS